MVKYQLKKRAERQEATRRRIVEETLKLHATVGQARTTVSEIARRAGVERLTVYRHFPDDESLFRACTEHYFSSHPPPDLTPLLSIADPEERLRAALTGLYAYFGDVEAMAATTFRDAEVLPALRRVALEPYLEGQRQLKDLLVRGWGVRGKKKTRLDAAISLALSFQTWRTLVREQALEQDETIDLMWRMVVCSVSE